MAYCVLADLQNATSADDLILLTDDAGTGAVVTAKITWAIAKADAYIDSYLRAQVTVPLTTVPTEVKEVSISLAIYYLYERRNQPIREDVRMRFEDATNWLKACSRGDVVLQTATSIITSGGRVQTNVTSTDKVYTSTFWDSY